MKKIIRPPIEGYILWRCRYYGLANQSSDTEDFHKVYVVAPSLNEAIEQIRRLHDMDATFTYVKQIDSELAVCQSMVVDKSL